MSKSHSKSPSPPPPSKSASRRERELDNKHPEAAMMTNPPAPKAQLLDPNVVAQELFEDEVQTLDTKNIEMYQRLKTLRVSESRIRHNIMMDKVKKIHAAGSDYGKLVVDQCLYQDIVRDAKATSSAIANQYKSERGLANYIKDIQLKIKAKDTSLRSLASSMLSLAELGSELIIDLQERDNLDSYYNFMMQVEPQFHIHDCAFDYDVLQWLKLTGILNALTAAHALRRSSSRSQYIKNGMQALDMKGAAAAAAAESDDADNEDSEDEEEEDVDSD